MIKLDHITFFYDNKLIINKMSADIKNGEAVMVTGDNGSGKTTLIRILNGLLFPHSGEYIFDGSVINKKTLCDTAFSKTFHSKIGYVFQNTDSQLFCSDVASEIAYGVEQMAMDAAEIKKRTDDMADIFDLTALLARAPYTLSAGEKKRVALASVLITNPKVLMLDEPLSGLDKKSRDFLISLLIRLKDSGKTILTVTHDDMLVSALGDREIKLQ